MKTGLLRICLLWLMILIIPAQAMAGAFSKSCTASPEAMQQAEMPAEHAHHAMADQADNETGDTVHSGCVLCAVSCHGISALTSCNTEPLAVFAPVLSGVPAYLLFVGQTPEPLKRPPRTVLL
ncbi:hypothetical protein [Halopseudomonas bauzanensis]|uniref:DUF2946 domain-containing protein n=1 Tax=Halopseudomonas bauzanensis TaxID=653930 RepID=A0A4U0YUZ3_9GAMM|nr:hypothetical protein [Halopseudomonas bauzanensis]EZQ18348.1 hypothetical protein CF98_25995 [Halopseudomonas bauzanensis]TKA92923.1 hypothetical protein FA869_01680 [Halopseudomonas bauzanensis]